jgi:hypothetical protein
MRLVKIMATIASKKGCFFYVGVKVKIPTGIIELCHKHGLRRGLDFF